jgi:hypothetical protein
MVAVRLKLEERERHVAPLSTKSEELAADHLNPSTANELSAEQRRILL